MAEKFDDWKFHNSKASLDLLTHYIYIVITNILCNDSVYYIILPGNQNIVQGSTKHGR